MSELSEGWRDELAGLSFEDAYRRLEETVGRLEQGELSLSESELLYWQGMELAQRCQQLLTESELRITQVGDGRDSASTPASSAARSGSAGSGRPGGDGGGSDDVAGDDDADDWEMPPPLEPDDPSLFEDDPPF